MPVPSIGEKVVFKSAFEPCRRDGEKAEVAYYGNNPEFPDGVPIILRFERDGNELCVRTDECFPIES